LTVAIGVTGVLLVFVTPTFEKMFKDFGGAMPAPTQIVISLSKFLQKYLMLLIGCTIAFAIAFKTWKGTPKGRQQWDRFTIQTPVFGPLIRKVAEATGAMDQMLTKIADFYDDEVDAAVAALTSMIEPIMMVFLGAIVGGFLIAMYLPIFSIAGAVK